MLISGGASVMVSSSWLSNRVSISSLFDVIVVVAVAVVVVLCCVPFGGKTERNMFGFGGPDVDESPHIVSVSTVFSVYDRKLFRARVWFAESLIASAKIRRILALQ